MNIGLVLSGGMAKGAYQVGALKALGTFIPLDEIKYISCSSVGVLNGYSYVTDKLSDAENMWKSICNEDARLFIGQLLRSSLLQQNIKNIYSAEDKIPMDFYCSLFNATHRKIIYKNLSKSPAEKIPFFLKASVAMPVYNRSVAIDGVSYFDGAMIDNIPVFPLLKHKLDYVICVYFDDICYKFENAYFDNKIIKITFPGENLLKQSMFFKKGSIEKMIQDGFDRASDILSTVLQKGHEDLEYIYNAIESLNSHETKSLRITGDVLVTNLNKVTQKFAKRKIL